MKSPTTSLGGGLWSGYAEIMTDHGEMNEILFSSNIITLVLFSLLVISFFSKKNTKKVISNICCVV